MAIEPLKDAEMLRDFLTRDRVAHAYLLGFLDEAYMPFCKWYGNVSEAQIEALVLVYSGLSLPAVLTVGPRDPQACDLALGALMDGVREQLPGRFWIRAWSHHKPVVERHFKADKLQNMIRMSLRRDDFKGHRDAEAYQAVRRLDHPDTAAIMALYRHYPDNFFEPYQLESGLYFGIDSDDGKGLAAIAGIHVFSQSHDIAAIGNLVTDPNYRRRGYATAVTTRLLDELFESVSLVTLNVQEGNVAAIGTYEKFGFDRHHVYYEGPVQSTEG